MTEQSTVEIKPAELGSVKRYQVEIYSDDDTHFTIADLEILITADAADGAINVRIVSNDHLIECTEIDS